MKLLCWWFGCYVHEQDPRPVNEATCARCDGYVEYSDLVGDTRHERLMSFLRGIVRKVWPRKCRDCGHRFKCDERVEHDDIPF